MKNIKFVPSIVTGRLSEADAKAYFSRFGWFVFVYFLINSLLQSAFAITVYYLLPSFYTHYLFAEFLSFVPNYLLALPLAYTIVRPLPSDVPMKEKMGAKELAIGFCICWALMMVGNYISQFVIGVFQAMRGGGIENPLATAVSGMPMWANLLFVVVLAPVLEELVFRRLMCKKLLVIGEGYAIVLSSAAFALCHGNFYQLFYAFTLGCFFAFIYVKTGRIIYTIIYHMAVNFLGGFVAPLLVEWLSDTSGELEGLIISAGNLVPYIVYMWYSFMSIGLAVFGIVIIIKKRREFSIHEGLLPPPEKKGASCVLLSGGVAASIALFALTLLGSLM